MACILCQTDSAREWPESDGTNTNLRYNCPRCGTFRVVFPLNLAFVGDYRQQEASELPYLTAYTRQATEAGRLASLDKNNYRACAAAHRNTSVAVKLRRVLEYLAKKSEQQPGRAVSIGADDYPLFDMAQPGEVEYFLAALEESGDIQRNRPEHLRTLPTSIITIKGWRTLMPTAPGGKPGTVFVAMAFEKDMDEAYDLGIRPAVEDDCGLSVTQVGRVQHNDSITDLIMAGIRSAQVVVADVTHQRNGVYFEAGFAMGLGRLVVWMCHRDDVKKIHFDTSHYNHVVWDDAQDLRQKLVLRLKGTPGLQTRP